MRTEAGTSTEATLSLEELASDPEKSIEEPPEKTLFLLVTHAPEKVLPTIASRCQCIRLVPVRRSGADADPEQDGERELAVSLLEAVTGRDLEAALDAGEAIAALPSRERVKAFFRYLSVLLRDVFLVQQGLRALSDAPGEDAAAAARFAPLLKRSYVRSVLPLLDRSAMLVERNVNTKIVVCDLVNKMFVA